MIIGIISLTLLISVLILFISFFMMTYNRFIQLRAQKEEAWSGIDVQLKRRHDLIPNVVETVKGYAGHEKGILEEVSRLRSQCIQAQSVQDATASENALTTSLKSVFALAENYPDLKANTNFLSLQQTLSQIEDDLQMARRYYNGTVRDYNTAVDSFPSNLIAGMFHFSKADSFVLDSADERNAPHVQF